LGSGEIKFAGQVIPDAGRVTYRIQLKRVIMRRLIMGIADGRVEVDGRLIYTGKDLRVGLFKQTDQF
jgi:3-hydroxyacyl-[acyl-carrier protein] dehydratase/trans-2-decenoyl-[acyl-carrier protein] isomerase